MTGRQERLFDLALREVFGAVRAPDVAGRVLAELESPDGAAVHSLGKGGPGKRRILLAVACVLAVALAALGAVMLLPGSPERFATAAVHVELGELSWAGHRGREHLFADQRATVALGVGDRLEVRRNPTVFSIAPFEPLYAQTNSILEVESMQLTERRGVLLLSGLTLTVITGAVAWDAFASPFGEGEEIVLPRPDGATGSAIDGVRSREELEPRDAPGDTEALDREPATSPPPGDPIQSGEEPPRNARFVTESLRESLEGVDWEAYGGVFHEYLLLNAEISQALLEGDLPMALEAQRRKLNGMLLEMTQSLMDGSVPGEGANGPFTHPLVAANTLSSALSAAGLDLDGDQLAAVDRITRYYAAVDESIRLGAEGRSSDLEGLVEEMEMKAQMFNELHATLGPEQQDLLFPGDVRGRSRLDVFGDGGDWGPLTRTVEVRGPSEFADILNVSFRTGLKLDEGQARTFEGIVRRWVDGFPGGYWQERASEEDRKGYMKTDRILMVGRRQSDLYREILQSMNLTAEQFAALREATRVFVPLPH